MFNETHQNGICRCNLLHSDVNVGGDWLGPRHNLVVLDAAHVRAVSWLGRQLQLTKLLQSEGLKTLSSRRNRHMKAKHLKVNYLNAASESK